MVSRLSFNSITARNLTLPELISLCNQHEVGYIAPWRDLLASHGILTSAAIIRNSGLGISSLCRGGMFTAIDATDRKIAIEDNFHAIDEAERIGAPVLVLVCGPVVNKNVADSQEMVMEGIAAIASRARDKGVALGIEPLHPMMAASRSCVTTVKQALDIADNLRDDNVKVVIDAYHVWSDPDLRESTSRIAGRIAGFHISDWITPITGELTSRGMPGEGCIDLNSLKTWVEDAGYRGPIEIEVLSEYWWSQNPLKTFQKAVDSFSKLNWKD